MAIEMSMKLSPKQAGKLYQKSLKQEQRIKELEQMLRDRLDLIRCGIGGNYSGYPQHNELYTSVVELLNKSAGTKL